VTYFLYTHFDVGVLMYVSLDTLKGVLKMSRIGISMGDEITVIVYRNKEGVGEVVSQCVTDEELIINVTTLDDQTALYMYEALTAAARALDYHMHRPILRALLQERIAELRSYEDEEGSEPPSPIDIGDIPF
jgi:hypothetical protein